MPNLRPRTKTVKYSQDEDVDESSDKRIRVSRPKQNIKSPRQKAYAVEQEEEDDDDDGGDSDASAFVDSEESDYHPGSSDSESRSKKSKKKKIISTKEWKASVQKEEALTEYEKLREKNIQERMNLLEDLHLGKRKSNESPVQRIKRPKEALPPREPSSRLQTKTVEEKTEPPKMPRVIASPSTNKKPDNPERSRHDSGPIDMFKHYTGSNEECENIIDVLRNASEDKFAQDDASPPLMTDELASRLSNMVLNKERVAKTASDRIFCITVHPGNSVKLVSTGGKLGTVSVWNLIPNEVHMFDPHVRVVSCIEYNRDFPQQLVSCSYDGTVRCTDLNKRVFNEVYKMEEDNYRNWISFFDFHSPTSLCLALGTGKMAIVDMRTNKESNEYTILDRALKTVNVHPSQRDYICVCTANDVASVYDLRKMKPKPESVCTLEHGGAVNSGFFSPCTGNYILTTSMDNNLRIFDSKHMIDTLPVIKKVKHDNQVGRWLTNFRAVWLPEREDSFVVGSMLYPRQIQVYAVPKGNLMNAFTGEPLQSVSSVNAFHPDLSFVAGGNSSGYTFVFQ